MEVRNVLDMQVVKARGNCRCKGLIHLSTILLPQGPLKVVQTLVTRCLDACTGRHHLYGGSLGLKECYLELIAKHCSDRVASCWSIWSLPRKILSWTTDNDTATSFAIFHCIIPTAAWPCYTYAPTSSLRPALTTADNEGHASPTRNQAEKTRR
ncbi:hypothetical protein BKA83DRAFT_2031231 [Pisolithus microcarpus]|nr:hypothetical protein BKA83DRAFT_2031231 [Pisolithus microcarpus]